MSTPTSDAFLRKLELDIKAELTQVETSQSGEAAVGIPIDEWLIDPADAQRYEVGLRNLVGAVEALEDGSSAGDHQVMIGVIAVRRTRTRQGRPAESRARGDLARTERFPAEAGPDQLLPLDTD
jgi:hypothetical protein